MTKIDADIYYLDDLWPSFQERNDKIASRASVRPSADLAF